jgi:hypothetical protein
VIGIGRSAPVAGRWVRCDPAGPGDFAAAAAEVGPGPLDALVHVARIWEETAFGPDHDLAARPDAETLAILNVNLAAPRSF